MAAVAVVMAPFFAVIIIATWQTIETSSPGDIILILLVDLRQIRFRESVAAFVLIACRVAMIIVKNGIITTVTATMTTC